MKIERLKLKNFMLYKKLNRVFGDKDIIGIICEYKNNPNRSNKGAKSTILESIRYALNGDSRAEREVELIHHGADEMMVELTLVDDEDDGRKITIKRGRDIKNNGVLEISGVEKKGEAQTVINELIGYNKHEFLLTTYFQQLDINQFMELKPAQKKQYLMQWLQNLHWSVLEADVNADIKEKLNSVSNLTAVVEAMKNDLADEATLNAEFSECEDNVAEAKHLVKKLETKLEKARGKVDEREKLESKIEELEESIEELDEAQTELDEAQKELKKLSKSVPKNADAKKLKKKETDLISSVAKSVAELDGLSSRIREVNDSCGTCPLLGEACDRIGEDNTHVLEWKKSRKKLKGVVQDLKNRLTTTRDEIKALNSLTEQENVVSEARKAVKDTNSLKSELKAAHAQFGVLEHVDVSSLKTRLKKAKNNLSELQETLGGLKSQLVNLETDKDKIGEMEHQIVEAQTEVQKLRYVAYMFGKNGIPSQEIENAFDEVEDEINFILERLGTSLSVLFKPDRETQQFEDLCVQCGWKFPKGTRVKTCEDCGAERVKKRKDELQLRVMEDGVDEGFWMESGGGKTLISLAVRLALTRLKQRQTGSKFNVLFLDEVDAALDKVNKQSFVDLMTKTLIKEFGFEQVFWVSHDNDLQGQMQHILKVIKFSTYSKTVWL